MVLLTHWKKSRDTGKTTYWGEPASIRGGEIGVSPHWFPCLLPCSSEVLPLHVSSPRPTPNNLLLLQTWAFTSHITTPLPSMAFKGPFDQPPTPKPPLPLVPASDLRLDFLMSAVFFCTSTLSWLCSLCSFTTHWLSSYYETAISTYPGYWGFTDKQISILAFKEVEDSQEM